MRPAEDWMETVSTLDCIRLRKSAVLRICKGPLKKSYFSQADHGRCQKLRTGAAGQRPGQPRPLGSLEGPVASPGNHGILAPVTGEETEGKSCTAAPGRAAHPVSLHGHRSQPSGFSAPHWPRCSCDPSGVVS